MDEKVVKAYVAPHLPGCCLSPLLGLARVYILFTTLQGGHLPVCCLSPLLGLFSSASFNSSSSIFFLVAATFSLASITSPKVGR